MLYKLGLKKLETLQGPWLANLIQIFNGYSPFPLGIIFHLTLRCNLRCKMCPQVSIRREYNPVKLEELELSLAELKAIIDDLGSSFILKPSIHLTGGEPLLYNNFMEFVRYIKSKDFKCSFTTNGVLLEKYAKELVALGVECIHVSLDGPQYIYDRIVGVPGAYERAIAGIRAISEFKKELNKNKPLVIINCVITEDNYKDLVKMINIAREVGADSLSYQHLIFPDCDPPRIDVDYLLDEIPKLKSKAIRLDLPITFYPRMKTQQVREYYLGASDELKGRCIFPWFVVRVSVGGDITPCRGYVVGNVRTKAETFREIWNNERFLAFRRKLAKLGIFPDCGRCCHRQYK